MNDFIYVLFFISITTGLIYFLYKIMLGAKSGKDVELQITSEDLVKQLNILYKQRKYNIVESLAKNYLEKKSRDDEVRLLLTKTLHAQNRIFDAIEQAKIIIKHQPYNFDIQIFLANCYMETDKEMRAIEVFQEILEKDLSNVVAIKELAKIYLKTNQKKSAIAMYKKLEEFLESDYEKAKNKATVAEIYIEFIDYEPAIKEYEQILEIYPEDINVKKRLIELYKFLSKHEKVIIKANELLWNHSQDEIGLWAMQKLIETYKSMNNFEKALELANMIKAHSLSNKTEVESDIAKILLAEGNIDGSIELLIALIAQEPQNISFRKELAKAYHAKLDFNKTIDIYKQIIELASTSEITQVHFEISDIYIDWAMYMFSKNENEQCFRYFEDAIKYYDQNPDIYYKLGNINMEIRNFNEAISQYKKAIEINPENEEYYYAISEPYKEIGSVYEQKNALIECLKYNSNNAKAHYQLGVICHSQNDINSAINYIKKAIELNPNFNEAKHKLALIFEHIGDKNEAIALYESILEIEPENQEILNNLRMLKP